MRTYNINQLGAIAGIAGAIFLFIGTILHPSEADPNNPQAAFAEYASSHPWVAIHLIQLLGIALMIFALVLLSKMMTTGNASIWAYIGVVGATASLAIAVALQAVEVLHSRWW